MAKRHILVSDAQQSAIKQSKVRPQTDWKLCVVCQENTEEPLQCPLRSIKQPPTGNGYISFSDAIDQFKTLKQMPMGLNLD